MEIMVDVLVKYLKHKFLKQAQKVENPQHHRKSRIVLMFDDLSWF